MRLHSFTARLKSLAFVFGIATAFTSCANEDVTQNPTDPNEENDKNLTIFVAGDETKTRTSLDYSSGNFYWEEDDYIYVKDDDGILRRSRNAPTSKVAAFKYMVPGKFTASASYKVYYLGKNSNFVDRKVTISAIQIQAKPDNTEHFGTSGDYGTAMATKVAGKQQFAFELEHQPAYLVFLPYTSNTILNKCYLTKVEVISDNDIAETYTVNTSTDNLKISAGGKKITLITGGNGSNPYGFLLTNSVPSLTTNGAYMIIKPGSHILKVRYWVKDIVTHVEGTITKSLPSTNYASNTYYDVTANLNVRDYDGNYYMWDAQDQYWKGHEWNLGGSQPILNYNLFGATTSNDYAYNNSDPRYYNKTNFGPGISNPATHTPCKDLPNANEMSWYVMYGDPRWDGDEVWTTMGHLYKGGMWLKKKSVLIAEGHYNTEKSADGTTDLRTTWKGGYSNTNSIIDSSGLPSAADTSNYFYLPTLGNYYSGKLLNVGSLGCYWSSSAVPMISGYVPINSNIDKRAYCLNIGRSYIGVSYNTRDLGFRVGMFE